MSDARRHSRALALRLLKSKAVPTATRLMLRQRLRDRMRRDWSFWVGILFLVYGVTAVAIFVDQRIDAWINPVKYPFGLAPIWMTFLSVCYWALFPAAFLYTARRSALERLLDIDMNSGKLRRCWMCDYDLRGSDADECPECGASTKLTP